MTEQTREAALAKEAAHDELLARRLDECLTDSSSSVSLDEMLAEHDLSE
jgi:hypothetical protein